VSRGRAIARLPEPEVMDDGLEVKAYEKADWSSVEELVARVGLQASDVPEIYLEAVGDQAG